MGHLACIASSSSEAEMQTRSRLMNGDCGVKAEDNQRSMRVASRHSIVAVNGKGAVFAPRLAVGQ